MMLRSKFKFAVAAVPLACVATFGAGCADDEDVVFPTEEPAPTLPPPPAETAELRVVHASPDAPAVDVWVEGQSSPAIRGIQYGGASPYQTLPAGTYNFQIRPAGAPATDAPVFSTGPVAVSANTRITALAAGLLSGATEADAFRVLVLPEGWRGAPDRATVRIVHASPDAPTVGIDVGDDDPASPEIASLMRFGDTGAEGIQLPAGESLQIGVVADAARVTAFTTPPLPAGGELFVIATGLLGKLPRQTDGFVLLPVAQTNALEFVRQNPSVYALHASPDAPAVDLFVGPREIVPQLAFGQLSAPIQIPPGTYTVDFFPAAEGSMRPAGDPAASAATPALEAGQRYLAAATGFLLRADATNKFALAALAEGFDLSTPSDAELRAWHLSPDAPTVDIGPVTDGTITPAFAGLAYLGASDPTGLSVPPATLPLGITPTGQNDEILFAFDVATMPGMRAFTIAAGAAAPREDEQPFRLLVVDTSQTPWAIAAIEPGE